MLSEVTLHQAEMSKELDDFFEDLCEGFKKSPKAIPSKYMYDAEGSRLFSIWTQTPEYYVYRCEK